MQAVLRARAEGPHTRSRGKAGLTGPLGDRAESKGKGPVLKLVRTPAQAAKEDAAKAAAEAKKAGEAKKAEDAAKEAAALTLAAAEEPVESEDAGEEVVEGDLESLSTDDSDSWAASVDEEAFAKLKEKRAEAEELEEVELDDDEEEETDDSSSSDDESKPESVVASEVRGSDGSRSASPDEANADDWTVGFLAHLAAGGGDEPAGEADDQSSRSSSKRSREDDDDDDAGDDAKRAKIDETS